MSGPDLSRSAKKGLPLAMIRTAMSRIPRAVRIIATVAFVIACVLAPLKAVPLVHGWWQAHETQVAVAKELPVEPPLVVLASAPDTLQLVPGATEKLGLELTEVAAAPAPEPLRLDGTLFLDANRMVNVRCRFNGDVIAVGEVADNDPGDESAGQPVRMRSLRYGDIVKPGQLLLIVSSKDLGEKKSEFVDALLSLQTTRERLERLEKLLKQQAVPEKSVLESRRELAGAEVAATRAERTLRSWGMADADMQGLRKEADEMRQKNWVSHPDEELNWGRVEIRAPAAGTIVEKNVVVGEMTSDRTLFKIADLSRLDVMAHVYEEDLPDLENLASQQRHWTIQLKSEPKALALRGCFNRIGSIIDPSQHTALVMGSVDNSQARLRVGQFITARIELPHVSGELAVPATAVVDKDGENYVLVKSAEQPLQFRLTRVSTTRRCESKVCLNGAATSAPDLHEGDVIIVRGAVEMIAELDRLKANAVKPATSPAPGPSDAVPAPAAAAAVTPSNDQSMRTTWDALRRIAMCVPRRRG